MCDTLKPSLPYEGEEAPPQCCDVCGEAIGDGYGWFEGDHIYCTACYMPHAWRWQRAEIPPEGWRDEEA